MKKAILTTKVGMTQIFNEAYLYSTVAVILHGLYLSNHAGTSLKHGYGNEHAIFIEGWSKLQEICKRVQV